MDISGAELRPELSERGAGVRARSLFSPHECLRLRPVLVFVNAKIGRHQQVKRRVLRPIGSQLFDLEQRHFVDYGVTVATGGGEEAVNLSPGIPRISAPAPGLVPGASASPAAVPPSFKPDPVSTAFSTEAALPRSSNFSTSSGVMSG